MLFTVIDLYVPVIWQMGMRPIFDPDPALRINPTFLTSSRPSSGKALVNFGFAATVYLDPGDERVRS